MGNDCLEGCQSGFDSMKKKAITVKGQRQNNTASILMGLWVESPVQEFSVSFFNLLFLLDCYAIEELSSLFN